MSLANQPLIVKIPKLGSATLSQLINLIYKIESAEQYEEMCKYVKLLVETKSSTNKSMDNVERHLVTSAYNNVVTSKLGACRILSNVCQHDKSQLMQRYKKLVEDEFFSICHEMLKLLKDCILNRVIGKRNETEIFFLCTMGNYYKYLAEINSTDEYKNSARKYYELAMELAEKILDGNNPTRLSLAIRLSEFYYIILKQPAKACDLAKKSFDAAMENEVFSDVSTCRSNIDIQLLYENLMLWSEEQAQDVE